MINTSIDTVPDEAEVLGETQLSDFKRKSLVGAFSYTFRSLALYGVSLITSLVLAAYLKVEEFGIFALVTQIIMLLQFFSDVGLGPALIQKREEPTLKEYRLVFTVQQLLSWLIFGLVLVLSQTTVIANKLGLDGQLVLISLGLALPLTSLKIIPAIILERKLDFSKLIIPNIFEQIVYSVILIIMVINNYGLMAYTISILARSVVGVLVMYLIQGWPLGLSFDQSLAKKILSVGIKFQLSDLLAKIKDNLFYLSLGWFLPIKEFGYISFAKQWSQVPYMLTVQNVISITFPAYSRLQHQPGELKKAIEKSIYFISLSIFPILVGMSIIIGPVVNIIDRYQKWEPAVLTFIFFTMSIGWAAISTPLTSALNAIGQINTTLKLMIIWTSLTYLLTFPMIYLFGFNGVSGAALIISFSSYLTIYYLKKYIPVEVLSQVKAPFLASLIMAVSGYLSLGFISQGFLELILGSFALGFVYLGVVLIIDHQRLKQEIMSVLRVIKL